MTNAQQEHLDKVIFGFEDLVTAKYTAGQKEHGGNLWDKKGLIDMALDEAIDQVVYLLTLKQQIEDSGVKLGVISEAN